MMRRGSHQLVSEPDFVLCFFRRRGLAGADIAALVFRRPEILCASIEKTLNPKFESLNRLGLSNPELVDLVTHTPNCLCYVDVVPKLQFLKSVAGSNHGLRRYELCLSHLHDAARESDAPPPPLPPPSAEPAPKKKRNLPEEAFERRVVSVPETCDLFTGMWVFDNVTYPLYKDECEFLTAQVTYMKNGREDDTYKKWRWQPQDCSLPNSDARMLLERLRGKMLMFAGDSFNRNQWESMVCRQDPHSPPPIDPTSVDLAVKISGSGFYSFRTGSSTVSIVFASSSSMATIISILEL